MLAFISLSLPAFGQEPPSTPEASGKMDYGFIAICCALVFIMQAGFCLLEMGFSRSKNSINIVMKNILDFAAGTIGFVLLGFGLMFGATQAGWVGWENFAFNPEFAGGHEIWLFCLFQVMFATATVTISSGAMAERTFFPGYLTYAFFACLLIFSRSLRRRRLCPCWHYRRRTSPRPLHRRWHPTYLPWPQRPTCSSRQLPSHLRMVWL